MTSRKRLQIYTVAAMIGFVAASLHVDVLATIQNDWGLKIIALLLSSAAGASFVISMVNGSRIRAEEKREARA